MKTKIIYALVSGEADYYVEQTLLSVYSLRKYNSNVVVELVVDNTTYNNLTDGRAIIKQWVNDIHIVEIPDDYTNIQKSRYIKTKLRHFVEGDYLFVDCDTIICDDLSEIDKVDAEIAMVADLNDGLLLYDKATLKKYSDAGFGNAEGLPYFNSGVIYAKDTKDVHNFYNVWYENWKQSSACGIMYDQPALCVTNVRFAQIIKELSGVWNCQFKMQGFPFLKDAKIMHYYSNNGDNRGCFSLPMDMLFHNIREHGFTPLLDNLVSHAKTDFYAVMTVNKEQAIDFFNSHFLYLYTNRPKLFYFLDKLGKFLEKPIYI